MLNLCYLYFLIAVLLQNFTLFYFADIDSVETESEEDDNAIYKLEDPEIERKFKKFHPSK